MCGIAGFYSEKQSPEQGMRLLETMLEKIQHRGPDYTGKEQDGNMFLGHQRLSIIDLSPDGNQPMTRGDIKIIFNGEIYNYKEIREELIRAGHVFKTGSDTEVILAAFQQWGDACTERFVGMWAFAIWEPKKQRLFCSRDRFGIKPFYYIFNNGEFYFASEYRPLKHTPGFDNALNLASISRGLQLGWMTYKDETYFEKINELQGAHQLVLEKGKIEIKRYWDVDFSKQATGTFAQKKEHFSELFKDSIQLHLRSDVPVAAMLSGGIDSSSIVSETSTLYPEQKLKTYSVFYEGEFGVDERPFIKKVIDKYPKNLDPTYFTPSAKELPEHFHRSLFHLDAPSAGSSYISQYFLMKLIHEQGIKVVLSGQGADDYLGGYMHSFYRHFADMLRQAKFAKATSELFQHKKNQGFSFGKTANMAAKSLFSGMVNENKLYNTEYKKYFPFLSLRNPDHDLILDAKGNNKFNAFHYQLMFASSLPSLLMHEDRNSMAFSIESRVPFLDHRLVEYGFSLNNSDKIHHASTKHILREALRPVLPQEIADRRDKKGFVTPGEVAWLRGPLRFLLEDKKDGLEMIDQRKAEVLIDSFKKGNNANANLVWRLVVLNYWKKHIA